MVFSSTSWEGSKCESETVGAHSFLGIWISILLVQGFGVQSQLSCAHTFIHPSTHPLTHSSIHPSMHSPAHSSGHLSIHPPIHPTPCSQIFVMGWALCQAWRIPVWPFCISHMSSFRLLFCFRASAICWVPTGPMLFFCRL